MIHRAQSLLLVAGLLVLGGAGSATAQAVYDYSSVVTLCTGTCASFASLDVGSTIEGDIQINATPSGVFGDGDILDFRFSIENPALPLSGPVGDPVNDNPQIVESALGMAQSTGSSITTDASNEIVGGTLLIELLIPPWSSNGAYLIFDLATGDGQLCLFYTTAGCIPGATQAVRFEGAFQNTMNPPTSEVYDYSSVVTLCTGTCASFASLDIGSTVQGDIEIASTASGSFDDSDILGFQFSIENPALPLSGPIGDPVNDNPQIVESALGTAQSTGSSITTDASNEIVGGTLLIELLIPPWSSNGAYLIFDLATGDGQLCLFYTTAGCIPGATQAVQFEGEFQNVPEPTMAWMLGPAVGLLAALGSARRRRASRRRAPDGQRSRFPS